jgi:hypothetical protein
MSVSAMLMAEVVIAKKIAKNKKTEASADLTLGLPKQ